MDIVLANKLFEDLYTNTIKDGRYLMFLRGLSVTLKISIGAIILGVFIGFLVVYMKMVKIKACNVIADVYIDIIRGTPAVTQLLIINYTIFAAMRNVDIWVGIVAMGINSGAYVAEIIRAGILSIDHGQTEAGRSLGFTKAQTMRYIIVPQAIKNILPALANEFIVLIKETAIVGYIAVEDLTKVGQMIRGKTFNIIPLFVTAILYFIIIKILATFFRRIENKLRANDSK